MKLFLTIASVFILIDALWLSIVSPYWADLVYQMTGKKMKVNLVAAVLSYLLIVTGLHLLVWPQIESTKSALFYGALFGMVVYGVFDFTNLAIFEDYNLLLALSDTLWGAVVSALTMVIVYKNQHLFR